MRKMTVIFVILFLPFFQFLNAQCLDLDVDLLQGCIGDPVELNVIMIGGEAPYNLNWSSGAESGDGTVLEQDGTFTIEVLESPSYSITVTDNAGCTETIQEDLIINAGATLLIEPVEIACAGELGTLVYTVNYDAGFAQPATILIQDETETEVVNGNLVAGNTYCVVVRDVNECVAVSECIEVSAPSAIDLSISINDQTCSDYGQITLAVIGGTPDYTFNWSDLVGSNDPQNRQDLTEGIYNVTVTDANGCTLTVHNIEVGLDNSTCNCEDPQIETIQVVNATCGASNGSITIEVVGNESEYDYNWIPSISTTNEANGLSAGTYSVTISDTLGNCFVVETITIENEDEISVWLETNTPATCLLNDGSVVLSPATYYYTWPDGGTSSSRTDLNAGTYPVTVTNVSGCTSIVDIEIGSENTLSETVVINAEPACNQTDGEVTIMITGGSGDYSFSPYGPVITNLVAGDYSIFVWDNITGCSKEVVFTLSNAIGVATLNIEPLELLCAGDLGTLIYTVDYGASFALPATIIIQDINGNDVENGFIGGGNYCIMVIDANGCLTEMECLEITAHSAIELSINISDQICLNDGSLSVIPEGGTAPYAFALNGSAFTSQSTFENLGAGTHSLSVIDANGCIRDTLVFIDAPITLDMSSSFANCDSTGGAATVTILGGASDPVFEWSNGQTGSELLDVAPGWYSVTVTDNASNCTVHQNIEVPLDPSCYVHISGYVFNDTGNEDCISDISTVGEQYILVELSNGDMTFTNVEGYYEFETTPGNYEVMVNLNNASVDSLCVDQIMVEVPEFGDISMDNNFWVKHSGTQDLYVYVSYGAVRPGFDQKVIVYAFNYGGYPMDGSLSFKHDDSQVFHAAIPTENAYDISAGTLNWDFEGLAPGASISFEVDLSLPATVELGTPISYTAIINPLDTDANPDNNIKEIDLLVTGSFDPNDKQVTPVGEGEFGNITRGDSLLTYQVRFQNTGTDTAFTVVILDHIEEDLDISTVRPGASSHPYELNILDGNVLEFRFENIMLPDSFVNEPASNGFVLFDIKTKRDRPYGTSFENTAEIYFDFNEPVITNTVLNTLAQPLAITKVKPLAIQASIHPNPGGDESILLYTLTQPSMISLEVYDINGNLVSNLLKSSHQISGIHQIDLGNTKLPKGIYFIRINSEERLSAIHKWVKMK